MIIIWSYTFTHIGHHDSSSDEDKIVIHRKPLLLSNNNSNRSLNNSNTTHYNNSYNNNGVLVESNQPTTIDTDIIERDEFVERLYDRDISRTIKKQQQQDGEVIETLSNQQLLELATKGTITNSNSSSSNSSSMVDQLREISRQHYLEKREEKELKLLELTLRDEKDLFDHEELTYEERNRYEINKKILEFSKDKNRFNYKDDSYKLPDSYEDGDGRIDKKKKEAVLTNRYIEETQVKSEQELWEESQMKTSKVKYVFEVLVLVVCMVDVKYIFLAYSWFHYNFIYVFYICHPLLSYLLLLGPFRH